MNESTRNRKIYWADITDGVDIKNVTDLNLHILGKCKPCAWKWKVNGCRNGDECSYCHLCPEGELKARRKAKIEKLKKKE